MNILSILKPLGSATVKRLPEILIGSGIGGMTLAIFLAVKAKPKADHKKEKAQNEKQAKYDKGEIDSNKLTKKEILECVGPCYIPAAVTYMISVAAIFAALILKNKEMATMAALYSISAEAVKEYQTKLELLEGREKALAIDKEINERVEQRRETEKRILLNKPSQRFDATHRWSKEEVVSVIPGTGPDLIYDSFCGTFFWGSKDEVERAFLRVKSYAMSDISGSYTVNDFRAELDLPDVDSGYLAFDSERGRVNELAWREYSPDGKVLAWAYSFKFKPTEYDY